MAVTGNRNQRNQAKADRLMARGGEQVVVDSLTGLQRAFVEEYVKDFDAASAVDRAGFKAGSRANASKIASQLLGNPLVKIAVAYYSKIRADKATVDVSYVLNQITKTIGEMDEKRSDPKHAAIILRGAELLARHLGMFVERTEISGPDGEAIQIQKTQEDADDLERAIARLAKRNGPSSLVEQSKSNPESRASVELEVLGEAGSA